MNTVYVTEHDGKWFVHRERKTIGDVVFSSRDEAISTAKIIALSLKHSDVVVVPVNDYPFFVTVTPPKP
jgi:hypothetical protein